MTSAARASPLASRPQTTRWSRDPKPGLLSGIRFFDTPGNFQGDIEGIRGFVAGDLRRYPRSAQWMKASSSILSGSPRRTSTLSRTISYASRTVAEPVNDPILLLIIQ